MAHGISAHNLLGKVADTASPIGISQNKKN